MPAPAQIFEPGKPHCPGCHAPLNALVDVCPHCGFSAPACLARFPYEPPALTRFMDPESRLTPRMRRKADRAIRRLERQFPQIVFHVCLLSLADGVDSREFGYWLFNRSVPRGVLEEQARPHSILLVIDRRSRTASLTIGYGLDPFIDDHLLAKALSGGAERMADGDDGLGIARIVDDLRIVLKRLHTNARYAFEKWQRRGPSRAASTPSVSAPPLPPVASPASRPAPAPRAVAERSPARVSAPSP